MTSLKSLGTAGLLGALLVSAVLLRTTTAASPDPGPPGVSESRAYLHSYNLPSSGLALEGYCPVAYFAVGKPVLGKPEFASTYDGVTYHFVSADAKKAFDAEPEKYLPAFGGWCAFGMAEADKFPVDPRCFKIVDGRLLLFLRNQNVDALELWNKGDEGGFLSKAEKFWARVHG